MELFKERRVLTVSALTSLIRGLLEENFDQVWVEGEISNFACPQSGHCYFTLKDAGA
jgi:exodeoxyribonuclease VII large subunit